MFTEWTGIAVDTSLSNGHLGKEAVHCTLGGGLLKKRERERERERDRGGERTVEE